MSQINKPTYETNDTENILPLILHKRAIQFARDATGINRPIKEHKAYIESFRECFKAMRELGMVSDPYKVESDSGDNPA